MSEKLLPGQSQPVGRDRLKLEVHSLEQGGLTSLELCGLHCGLCFAEEDE